MEKLTSEGSVTELDWFVFICVCVQVHIEFTDGEERISLEGPTEEVEQAQAQIQEIIKDLVSTNTHIHKETINNRKFIKTHLH